MSWLDEQKIRQKTHRQRGSVAEANDHKKTDREATAIKISNKFEEDFKIRRLSDAIQHFEMRVEETEDEHHLRLLEQKKRQRRLRLAETSEERESRQSADAQSKAVRRAAGAGAAVYEKFEMPGQNWSTWVDINADRTPK